MSLFVINGIINIIQMISSIFILLVVFNVFLPYFLSPANRFREIVDRIVNPFLILLRRYIPPIGRFDFTPVILVILVQLVTYLLTSLLASLVLK
jgi:YggT family protein